MTAATALGKQIERYRSMTGEQRLAVALELHELSCDIAREGIRRQTPARMPPKLSACFVTVSNLPALHE